MKKAIDELKSCCRTTCDAGMALAELEDVHGVVFYESGMIIFIDGPYSKEEALEVSDKYLNSGTGSEYRKVQVIMLERSYLKRGLSTQPR